MAITNQVNRRQQADALLQVSKALPAANNNNTTDLIPIPAAGPVRERLKLRVEIPSNTALVATKTLTLTLVDSADGSASAAVAGPGQSIVIAGIGGNGIAAQTRYFEIPNHAREYVGVLQAVEADGGNNTGTTIKYSLVS
jgi:hypothetical protein